MEVKGLNPTQCNLRSVVREKLLTNIIAIDDNDWGKKVLIVDTVTMLVIDSAIEMNEITMAGVADVCNIMTQRLPLPSLEAIYFISATQENVDRLIDDFDDIQAYPYKRIHLYFTTTPSNDMLRKIGAGKVAGRIASCKVADINFLVYDSHTFHFGTPKSFWNLFSRNSQRNQVEAEIDSIAEKLCSVCTTFEDFPVVRYAANSPFAGTISEAVHKKLGDRFSKGLIKKNQQRGQLLILDRTHDLISPIIHELYYQAMVADIIRPPQDVYKCPYKDANGYDQKYVVILNENDPIYSTTRHLHIKKAREWIVANVKTFTEQSKALQASGDIQKIARAMPQYQHMKTKYSVHSSLSKKCFDDYGELKLERIISAEQAMATGQTEDGQRVGVPQDLSGLIRGNDIRVSDKLRLLMLLYASDPTTINQRPQFELNSGLSTLDQACTQEWCRIVEMAGRRNQRRPPAHETEWQFLTSRYIPAVHDLMKAVCTDKLNNKDFCYEDNSEASISFSGGGGGSFQSKRSSVRPGFGLNSMAPQGKQPALYIFIAGGISYNEIRLAHVLSQEFGRDIFIGSTHIYSPLDLVDQLSNLNNTPDSPCYKSCFIGDQDYFTS